MPDYAPEKDPAAPSDLAQAQARHCRAGDLWDPTIPSLPQTPILQPPTKAGKAHRIHTPLPINPAEGHRILSPTPGYDYNITAIAAMELDDEGLYDGTEESHVSHLSSLPTTEELRNLADSPSAPLSYREKHNLALHVRARVGLLQPRPLVSAISSTICGYYTDVALTILLEDHERFKAEVVAAEKSIVTHLNSRPLTAKSLVDKPDHLKIKLLREKLFLDLRRLEIGNPCAVTTYMGKLEPHHLASLLLPQNGEDKAISDARLHAEATRIENIIGAQQFDPDQQYFGWAYGPGDEGYSHESRATQTNQPMTQETAVRQKKDLLDLLNTMDTSTAAGQSKRKPVPESF